MAKLSNLSTFMLCLIFSSSLVILGDENADRKTDPCKPCVKCKNCPRDCIKCPNCKEEFSISRSCVIAMAIGAGVSVPFSYFILGFLGFAAAGVGAGTLAALWQSTMGGIVAEGGVFALLQSIGAAGFSTAGSAFVSGAAGAAMYKYCDKLGSMVGIDMTGDSQIVCD